MKEIANEAQRNDPELNAAVLAELVKHRKNLNEAINLLLMAKDLITEVQVERHSSRIDDVRSHIYSDVGRLEWFVKYILNNVGDDGSAYVGNMAAFMSPAQAEALKEKYRKDASWRKY